MNAEMSGVLWLVVTAGGAAALAVAFIIGGAMWLARDSADDVKADAGTRQIYDEPDEARDPADREERVG